MLSDNLYVANKIESSNQAIHCQADSLEKETVVSLASPPGVGGLAVIQLAGVDALGKTLGFLRNRTNDRTPLLVPNHLQLVRWMDGQEHVDDVIVVAGESHADTQRVCITTHGSVRVVERILLCLEQVGVRLERELSMASTWAHLSPIEAAVMNDLPRAQTKRVACWLISQLNSLPQAIRRILALLNENESATALLELQKLKDSFKTGRLLLDGARVVIVGPPNAGKSTLANRLFEKPRSLESELPGTTRDWVDQSIAIEGIPLVVADTVGLRIPKDELELEAINLTKPVIRNSHVQILLLDASDPNCGQFEGWIGDLIERGKLLLVLNKSDLGVDSSVAERAERITAPERPVVLSARTGEGLGDLKGAILQAIGLHGAALPLSCIWDDGHRRILEQTLKLGISRPLEAAALLSDTFLGSISKK